MIKKVITIKGTGKYYSYAASGDGLDFGKNTLIFSNNGRGKTTLSKILAAMAANDIDSLIERKTLGRELQQNIVVKHTDGTIVFDANNWNYNGLTSQPIIHSFDQDYINDNLFVIDITAEHKKRIHSIVLGQNGVTLSTEVTDAKNREAQASEVFRIFSRELEKKIAITGRRDYLTITAEEKPTIENTINVLSRKINAKKNSDMITQLPRFSKISTLKSIDAESLEITFNRTPTQVAIQAKNLTLGHIANNMQLPTTALEFIQTGLKQKKTDNCPFCGQAIHSQAAELLDAYGHYFDHSYLALQSEVATTCRDLRARNFIAEMKGVELSLANLNNIAAQWRPFLGDDFFKPPASIEIGPADAELNRLFNVLLSQAEQKEKNINLVPDISAVNDINILLNLVNQSIESINLYSYQLNNSISSFIESVLVASDLAALGVQLNAANAIILRFSPSEDKWCNGFYSAKQAYELAVQEHNNKRERLSEYSEQIFTTHQDKINSILQEIGADFTISSLRGQADRRTNKPYADFSIIINDSSVCIARGTGEGPCFTNTLSAGDKNSLAFAFFVAFLESDPGLTEAIILLDDPLTSMDDSRRLNTVKIIGRISRQANQTIILTHKRDFLYMLCDELSNISTLSIKSDRTNGSKLTSFDVDEDRKIDHHKRIDRMTRFIAEDYDMSVESIQSDIRKALETALKFKYYKYLTGVNTLGSIIDKLLESGKLESAIIAICRDLNRISSPVHHGETGQEQPLQSLQREEIIPFVQQTIATLEEI
ncbi:MAG: AAA family ATPase [Desulfarculus sp.]|nr:AAA family ATPase [Desulfarculus sp.]